MDKRERVIEIGIFIFTIISVGSIVLLKIRVDYLSSIPLSISFSSILSKALYVIPFLLMILNVGLLQFFKLQRLNSKISGVLYLFVPLFVVGFLTLVHYQQLPTDFNYFYSRTGILPNVEVLIYIYLLAVFMLGAKINLYPAIKITTISIGLLKQYLYRIPLLFLLVWGAYSFVSITTIPASIAHSRYPNNLTLDDRVEDVEKIAELTSPDTYIVHPLRTGAYPFLGNQVMMRYFLTPRVLVTPEKLGKSLSEGKKNPFFIAIKNSESEYVWPVIDLEKNQIFSISREDNVNVCKFVTYKVITVSSHLDLIAVQCEDIK